MDFGILVEYYDKVESTRKRLEIIGYLTELFKKLKENPKEADDLEKIVYLTQGTIYPTIMEQPKLNLAEKSLMDFISSYYAVNVSKVENILKKTGDLGDTGQKLAEKKSGKKSQITSFMGMQEETVSVADIYNKLEEISKIQGSGSLDKKESKIHWLLARCKPLMVKYLMRIITSTMRLGVSDPTIMDALAIAYLGDKDHRTDVERAYNVHPDLGLIARKVYDKGLKGLEEVKIQIGTPIRMMLASRLNYNQILPKLGGEKFLSEYKLDGERLQVHKDGSNVTLFSRRLTNITEQYPDVREVIKKSIKAEKIIIEGEAVAMDPFYEEMQPFQVLITRKRKYDIEEMVEKVPVCLFVFDILYIERDGKEETVMDYPLLERRGIIKDVLDESEKIKLTKGKFIESTDELVEFFKEARAANAEGIMNKSIDPEESVYKAGNRGFLWVKLKSLEAGKMTDTIDVVPIGALWGKGKRANQYGTLLVAVYNEENGKFELLTRVASGFSDDDLTRFLNLLEPFKTKSLPNSVICSEKPDVWFKPGLVIEISGDELTISPKADAGKNYNNQVREKGYSVRFPVFQRIRNDKEIFDITTVDEIVELYELQG
ncbi:MAG: ATP-dependent DNA ligase [Candidatus Lokiarchaeota archaeon]|nr:ATP-dependent DNA ligase [Candidatus Lokiarchaeota archaeon]